jgi:hypothetical protein
MLLFWLVCIPTRLAIALVADRAVDRTLHRIAAAALCGSWMRVESKVGFFGGKAWWSQLRPYHIAAFGLFALFDEPLYLYLDAVIGAVAYVHQYGL